MIASTWHITEEMQAGFAWGCAFASVVLFAAFLIFEGRQR